MLLAPMPAALSVYWSDRRALAGAACCKRSAPLRRRARLGGSAVGITVSFELFACDHLDVTAIALPNPAARNRVGAALGCRRFRGCFVSGRVGANNTARCHQKQQYDR